MTLTPLPAILNIPAQDYHADTLAEQCGVRATLSCSIANTMETKTPLHAWTAHPRLNPDFEPEHKDVFDLGSAAHNMVLRQDRWREEIDVIDAEDRRKKATREAIEASHAAGRHPVLKSEYARLEAMVTVLEAHPHAGKAFRDGKPEQTIVWKDKETGVICRARPDWLPNANPKPEGDYKTSGDAKPSEWNRRFLLQHGGILRGGWYHEAFTAIGRKNPTLYYIVQETRPPYAIVCQTAMPEVIDYGKRMMRKALRTWAECLDKDVWPAYEFIQGLSLPEWKRQQLEAEYEGP